MGNFRYWPFSFKDDWLCWQEGDIGLKWMEWTLKLKRLFQDFGKVYLITYNPNIRILLGKSPIFRSNTCEWQFSFGWGKKLQPLSSPSFRGRMQKIPLDPLPTFLVPMYLFGIRISGFAFRRGKTGMSVTDRRPNLGLCFCPGITFESLWFCFSPLQMRVQCI